MTSIYFDNSATTALSPAAKLALIDAADCYGNPSSLHREGRAAAAILNNYYDTGDIAKMDIDGYIYITGRASRFSKIGGEMVPHEGVELALCQGLDPGQGFRGVGFNEPDFRSHHTGVEAVNVGFFAISGVDAVHIQKPVGIYGGQGFVGGKTDGAGAEATFKAQGDLTMDKNGNLVSDSITIFKDEKSEDQVFGRNIFNTNNLTFEPSNNLPTPANYRLGPGDEITIDIWGTNQVSIQETITPDEARELLAAAPGLIIQDDPHNNVYPMPLFIAGKDPVYVGRVREDLTEENGLTFWCVADQIKKGAALNAVQIAEWIIKNKK